MKFIIMAIMFLFILGCTVPQSTENPIEQTQEEQKQEIQQIQEEQKQEIAEKQETDVIKNDLTLNQNRWCTDSDGGSKYYIKGRVIARGSSAYDYCLSDNDPSYIPNTLVEYYCTTDRFQQKKFVCPYGCSDGACLNKTQ